MATETLKALITTAKVLWQSITQLYFQYHLEARSRTTQQNAADFSGIQHCQRYELSGNYSDLQ